MSKAEFKVEVRIVKIKDLVHSESNPRLIKRNQHENLKKSLTDFPEMKELREPVVDEKLLILAGDKRVYALEEMGYTDIKVKQVFGLSEEKKREFIAKDNLHNGDWDPDIIANQWDTDKLADWGLPQFKMPGADDEPKEKKEPKRKDVDCPNCGFTFDPSEKDE